MEALVGQQKGPKGISGRGHPRLQTFLQGNVPPDNPLTEGNEKGRFVHQVSAFSQGKPPETLHFPPSRGIQGSKDPLFQGRGCLLPPGIQPDHQLHAGKKLLVVRSRIAGTSQGQFFKTPKRPQHHASIRRGQEG